MFLSLSSNQLTTCLTFSAFRVILSDPAQVAEEVIFAGRRASGRWAKGGMRDGGGREHAAGGGRLTGGWLQEPAGVDSRAGRQLAIADCGKKFA